MIIKDTIIKFLALATITITILLGCYSSASANIVPTEILGYYSDSYNDLRNKFLTAARLSGGRIENYRSPVDGPGGEALYIDVACFGVNNPKAILVLGSGTHGVEGFAGSAIQTGLLRQGIVSTLAPHVGLVMIHAINPYGVAHLRRVNEDNVDLNRNFLDHSKLHPSNEGYEHLANAIAPQSLSLWNDTTSLIKLLSYRFLHGTTELRLAISGGQYTHPKGLFYGGHSPTWSNKTVNEIAHRHLLKAERVVVIDFHTGLGSYGNAEVIMNVNKDSPAYQRARQWWGDLVTSTVTGDSVSTQLSGTLKLAFDQMLPDSEVTAVSLEFGTLPRKEVLWALRSENWLHHHGGSEHPDSKQIKNDLLRAFYPDDKEWKLDIWRQSRKIVKKVIDRL
jgi:predicted deacylase